MTREGRPRLVLLVLVGLGLAGCSKSDSKTVPISGTVTWNGEPLPRGYILFQPEEGGEGDAGEVREGKFSFRCKPGKKKVDIRATKEYGAVDPTMGARPQKQYLPAQYNDKTTLTAEVAAGGDNRFEFPLHGPP